MKTFLITGAIVLAAGFIFRNEVAHLVGTNKIENRAGHQRELNSAAITFNDIVIRQQWDLPPVLLEVSGIAYLDEQRFACVQDEAGTIFIYNITTASIEKEIPFSGAGDFEGISLNGDTAYVVRSDGAIFEVNMISNKTSQYRSSLTIDNNVETLFYDKLANRLLMAGKEPDKEKKFKNIYAFDIGTKSMIKEPVLSIDLGDPLFIRNGKAKKKKKMLMPSGIAIHPINKDIYLLDGPASRLVVTRQDGVVKNVYELGKAFYKPEGISFSPAGDLFISNEGKKTPPNIIMLELTK